MDQVVLFIVSYAIFVFIVLIVSIIIMNNRFKKKYKEILNELEVNKNLIISASILSELNKVEALANNDILKQMLLDWKNRFNDIKDNDVTKITDDLIELDNLFSLKDYKSLKKSIVDLELNICVVKVKANHLLNEIRELTLSEEKNREIVSNLKIEYREIFNKFNKKKNDYKYVTDVIELQFENVEKLFSAFEVSMEKNEYTEISKIVKAIDDLIGNLTLVIDETPNIILLGKSLIPIKIEDIKSIYEKMIKDGYQLDYINLPYNIEETNKKIADIFDRLKVLNIEDSLFTLNTLLDYYDSLYNDFDKEKESKKVFIEYSKNINDKIPVLDNVNKKLLSKANEFKYSYDLTDEEINVLNVIDEEIENLQKDFNFLVDTSKSKSFPYSKLEKDIELLNVRMTKIKDKLEVAIRTFGSLKEDELRAREQLDEIKIMLKESKYKINSFKLPIIPKEYFVELSEASSSIKEVVNELEKKVINISTLNTRVDTARDLVLKLYNTSSEIVKSAWMAEKAIVYGNRYRPINKEIDLSLFKAENLFYKGNFRNSLECAITGIRIVEPNIQKRLLEEYNK